MLIFFFIEQGLSSVLPTLIPVSVNWCSKHKEPPGQENLGNAEYQILSLESHNTISILKALKGPAVTKKPL